MTRRRDADASGDATLSTPLEETLAAALRPVPLPAPRAAALRERILAKVRGERRAEGGSAASERGLDLAAEDDGPGGSARR